MSLKLFGPVIKLVAEPGVEPSVSGLWGQNGSRFTLPLYLVAVAGFEPRDLQGILIGPRPHCEPDELPDCSILL
jgi:hypothetical protein